MTKWDNMNRQSTWKKILMNEEKMNSKEKAYYSYDYNSQNEEEDKE